MVVVGVQYRLRWHLAVSWRGLRFAQILAYNGNEGSERHAENHEVNRNESNTRKMPKEYSKFDFVVWSSQLDKDCLSARYWVIDSEAKAWPWPLHRIESANAGLENARTSKGSSERQSPRRGRTQ